MLYRFKSKAAADVVMVQAHGDRVLQAMGREPAPQGIVTVGQMGSVIARLRAAIEADELARSPGASASTGAPDAGGSATRAASPADEDDLRRPDTVALRQRAWPMLDLLQRSLAESADVVWGT